MSSIRAPNWLGDAVMALPAMAAVRAGYPGASLAVAAIPSVAPLFLEQTAVGPDEVLTVETANGARRSSRAGRFDAVVLLPNSFRSAWVARRAGIAERWGYRAGARGWLLTRAVARPRGRVHQADVLPASGRVPSDLAGHGSLRRA